MADVASESIQSSRSYPRFTLTTQGLTVVLSAIVLIIALLKCDSKDVPKIIDSLVGTSAWPIIGWTLAIVFLIFGAIIVELQRRSYTREIDRLVQDRNDLQKRLMG